MVAENVYFGDSKRDSGSDGYSGAPAYGNPVGYGAPSGGYGSPAGYGGRESSGFAEIDDQDGDLPF